MTGSSEELARTGDYPELPANCSTVTWEEANKVSELENMKIENIEPF